MADCREPAEPNFFAVALGQATGECQHSVLDAGVDGDLHRRPHHRLAERVVTPQEFRWHMVQAGHRRLDRGRRKRFVRTDRSRQIPRMNQQVADQEPGEFLLGDCREPGAVLAVASALIGIGVIIDLLGVDRRCG
jgi:hypothetical protein